MYFDSDLMSGDDVDEGARESLTSIITSSLLTSSESLRAPLAMWPGYHTVLGTALKGNTYSVERPVSEKYRPSHVVNISKSPKSAVL